VQVTFEPGISEWGNPSRVMPGYPASGHMTCIGGETTQGSETSQYLEEKKPKGIPSVAASERGRA